MTRDSDVQLFLLKTANTIKCKYDPANKLRQSKLKQSKQGHRTSLQDKNAKKKIILILTRHRYLSRLTYLMDHISAIES